MLSDRDIDALNRISTAMEKLNPLIERAVIAQEKMCKHQEEWAERAVAAGLRPYIVPK